MHTALARGTRRCLSSLNMATWEHAEQAHAGGVFNLAVGQPAKSLMPISAVDAASSRLSTNFDARYLLQYGSLAGSTHYVEAVSKFVTAQTGLPHNAANFMSTPGSSGGLALLARSLTKPGDVCLMEDPSYFLAHKILRDYGLELVSMAQRTDGAGTIDVDHVEKYLSSAASGGGDGRRVPKMLYMVPTGNNPTGRTMPDGDRARLVRLCAEHKVHIVSDDVYELLQFSQADAPKPMRWHATQLEGAASTTVISLGSWSKIIGPGLRLGWLEATPELITELCKDGEVDSGSLTSPLVETIVTEMLDGGEGAKHIEALKSNLSRRANLLADAINKEQPAGEAPIVDLAPAGYFLWVDLKGLDADALRTYAAASHGVTFLPGAKCCLDGSVGNTHGRVCFAFYEEDDLVEAGKRLGRAIAQAHAEGIPTNKRKVSALTDAKY